MARRVLFARVPGPGLAESADQRATYPRGTRTILERQVLDIPPPPQPVRLQRSVFSGSRGPRGRRPAYSIIPRTLPGYRYALANTRLGLTFLAVGGKVARSLQTNLMRPKPRFTRVLPMQDYRRNRAPKVYGED